MKVLAALALLLTVQPVAAQPHDWEVDAHERHIHGARILVLKDYHLGAGETARGPIVVVGGSATIDGHADDDVVGVGGRGGGCEAPRRSASASPGRPRGSSSG